MVGLPQDKVRLDLAKELGCTALFNEQLKDWSLSRDGLGCDGVVDAAGVSATLRTAIDIVRPAGWISKVGWGRDPLGFSIDPLVQKNITLQGSFSHTWAIWERVLHLLDTKAIDVSKIVGGSWSLEHWHDAFETMHSGKIAKAVLEVQPELAA